MQTIFGGRMQSQPTASGDRAAHADARGVADHPVVVIERKHGWRLVDWPELWRFRELLYFFAWRDIKVRYKETVLGAAWAILKPISAMAAVSIFFWRFAGAAAGESVPYSLFVFTGFVPWFFFSGAIGASSSSVVVNQSLFTKVYFPRILLPIAASAEGLVDFAVALVMLVLLMLCFGVAPNWNILMVPVIVLLLGAAAMGVGTLLSALAVIYRDVMLVVPFMTMFWMFMTPTIFFPRTVADAQNQRHPLVSPELEPWLPLNPAYGLIYNFREAMLGGTLDWYALGVSSAVGGVLLVVGCCYFRRVEHSFPDLI